MKTMLSYAALLAAALTAPAVAQNPASPPTTLSVSYADLDLRSEAGVKILDQRIRNAVSAACGIPSPADAYGKERVEKCRDEARGRAHARRSILVAAARERAKTSLAAAD
jgi:UrcA family protein